MSEAAINTFSPERRRLIEKRARFLQLEMWNLRADLWSNSDEMTPVDVLQPGVAIEMQGYAIETHPSLGVLWDRGRSTDIAGQIDRREKVVLISARYPFLTQNFTAAHELGHLILHPHLDVMHRDLPEDGPSSGRPVEEREADWFAQEFLMPEKQVRIEFKQRFGPGVFELSEATAFALCRSSAEHLRNNLRCARDLTRLLAQAIEFDGNRFVSLSNRFSASPSAMSIRLNQLNLVRF